MVTEDRLLGGRVTLVQPDKGYRVAIDPVFLAAAVQPSGGALVLDAGCGTGAAALCLAARVPFCMIEGVEIDREAARLARDNIARNGLEGRLTITTANLADHARAHAGCFDQVMTNPPFHMDGAHTLSPCPGKAGAHGESALDLVGWIKASSIALVPGGVLTVIHRADRLADLFAAFAGRFGAVSIFPLWPRSGAPARRIVVRAIKGRRTAPQLLAGLVLHRADGSYTDAAEAILRDGAALEFGAGRA